MDIQCGFNFIIDFISKLLFYFFNWIIWFLCNATIKERGEIIVNVVIYFALIISFCYLLFISIYWLLGYGYVLWRYIIKKNQEFKKILVKGDFGSGKTYFVNHDEELFNFLKLNSKYTNTLENYKKKLYISCTGKTASEILKELYFALLPRPIKYFEKMNVLDMISHIFHIRKYEVSDIKDYILKSASKKYDVIIIDDFERMCFGESINDEIHQFMRLIIDKLEKHFHIVFIHSTNSRMFADNQYKLKHSGGSSDKYYLKYIENFDSNIGYLLEKNEWDKEHTCETSVKKCLEIPEIYKEWCIFLESDTSIVIDFLRVEIEKLNNLKYYEISKEISVILKQLLKDYAVNENVNKMFNLLIMESVYLSVMNHYINKGALIDKNTNSFNYRTALSYAKGLTERNIYDFFNKNNQNIELNNIIMRNKDMIINMHEEIKK